MAFDTPIDTDTGLPADWWDPNVGGYGPNAGVADPRSPNYNYTDPTQSGPGDTPPNPHPPGDTPPTPGSTQGPGTSVFDFTGRFNAPTFTRRPDFSYPGFDARPDFSYPSFDAPADFNYADFTAPTLADAQNEPGYQFAAQEGEQRLQNSAAAKGLYRTGGTLKDIYSWANKFGEQNYGNVYNRAKTTYDTNRGNAFGNAEINATNRLSAYTTNRNNAFQNATTNTTNALSAYEANRGNAFDNYSLNSNIDLSQFDRNYRGAFDTQNFTQQAGLAGFSNQNQTLQMLLQLGLLS